MKKSGVMMAFLVVMMVLSGIFCWAGENSGTKVEMAVDGLPAGATPVEKPGSNKKDAPRVEPVPEDFARGFLDALKKRNISEALTYCDVSVFDDGAGMLGGGVCKPQDFCTNLASWVNDDWICSVNPDKIYYWERGYLYNLPSFFENKMTFVIGDTKETSPYINVNYVKDYFNSKIKARGWIIFVQVSNRKMMIYRVRNNGIILE